MAGFNWGNAFGLGHQMTVQVTSDLDVHHSKAVSGNYSFDLPWRHTVTLSGAFSNTNGIVRAPFSLDGESWQAGINYDIPLPERKGGRYTQILTLGFDFKSSDNNFEFASIPVPTDLTHVVQGRARYTGTLVDGYGYTTASVTLVGAPGGLTVPNKDEFFDSSRSNATANYVYGRLDITRNTQLGKILDGWEWKVRGSLQISSDNLIGSEQFGVGGLNTVRGYEEGEVFGDQGALLSQEIILPAWQPAVKLLQSKVADSMRLYVFQDYARTWSVQNIPGEKPFHMHSLGVGFRYQLGLYAAMQFAYGWQLRDSGSSDTGDNSRGHFTIQLSY